MDKRTQGTFGGRCGLVLTMAVLACPIRAQFVDSCFSSLPIGTSFGVSDDLAGFDGDLLEWTGTDWVGDWPNALVSLPPPSGAVGCHVIFIGNAVSWTTGGEGFGLRLVAPIVAGQNYQFVFNYASHGMDSNGAFTFDLLSNSTPDFFSADYITTSPPVGFAWTVNTISFTAGAAQAGDDWIILHNGTSGTSGVISSFCSICSDLPMPCPPISLGPDLRFCEDGSATLSVSVPGAGYLWSDGSTTNTITVEAAGTYWVQASTPDCLLNDTVEVVVDPNPAPDLPEEVTICSGDSVLLDVTAANTNYLWSTGATAGTIQVTTSGLYTVELTLGSCGIIDSVLVIMRTCDVELVMPNVFSPNGDGENDTFMPLEYTGLAGGSLMIYNRWGQLMETVDLQRGWKGRHDGDACPEGTYFWTLIARPIIGSERRDHGTVTLLR